MSTFRIHGLIIYLLLIFIPLLSYPGGGKTDKQKEELKFWHSTGTYNKEALNSLLESFNKENKGMVVKGVFQGSEEDLYLKLLSQETLPDIVQIPVQYIRLLQEKNLIIDISSLIPHKLKDDIPVKFWESVEVNKGIYGMPFSYGTYILFVNQHILRISGTPQEKEPDTWKDISDIAVKIRDNTKNKWGVFIPLEKLTQFISFVESYSGKSIYHDNKLVVDSGEVISAMVFLQKMVYQDKLMPQKITMGEGEQMFLSGNLGLMLSSSSMLVYSESNLPYDLNVWHLPINGKVKPTITGTSLSIIRSNPKREAEAFKFIEYITNYDSAIKWHTHTGNPAIRTSVKDSLDLLIFYEEHPNYVASVIEMEEGKIFNPEFDFIKAEKVMKKALEEIMINGENPEKVLQKAQEEL